MSTKRVRKVATPGEAAKVAAPSTEQPVGSDTPTDADPEALPDPASIATDRPILTPLGWLVP